MPIELKMPALSPTMEEGTLAKWLVKEGDEVKSGDILAEIETDKATMEFEAVDEGKIAKILVPEGTEGVKVGAPIAILAGEGEDVSGCQPHLNPLPRGRGTAPAQLGRVRGRPKPDVPVSRHRRKRPSKRRRPRRRTPAAPSPAALSRAGRGRKGQGVPARQAARPGAEHRPRALQGSGPGGRIVRADVDAAAGKAPAAAPAGAPAAAPALGTHLVMPGVIEQAIPHEEVKLSNIRKTIARRLTEAKQQVPHIYLTVDIQLDALLKLRGELNKGLESRGIKLSVNDLHDQGAGPVADRSARVQRRLRRRPPAQVQPRRHFGRGVDPRRPDHADHRRRREPRASRRSRPR